MTVKSELAPEEWDFSAVSESELQACHLYVFARESRSILRLSKTITGLEFTDTLDAINANLVRIRKINPQVAVILANLAPSLNLSEIPWQLLEPEWKTSATALFRPEKTAFREANDGEISFAACMLAEETATFPSFSSGIELVLGAIDWTQPKSAIKKAFLDWLHRKSPSAKRGRHAKPSQRWRDALRCLAASRLLARYSLKDAIETTKARARKPLYSPAPAPWNKAVDKTTKYFRELLKVPLKEAPISVTELQRRKNRN